MPYKALENIKTSLGTHCGTVQENTCLDLYDRQESSDHGHPETDRNIRVSKV